MSYWPVSDKWGPALTADIFTPYSYVDVFENYKSSAPLNTTPMLVISGTVNFDSTASVRRTASQVTFVPTPELLDIVPNTGTDLLFPDGAEIEVHKGFVYPDGTTETAPQGRFLIENAVTLDSNSGGTYNLTVAVDGSDRMATIARNEWTDGYSTVPIMQNSTSVPSSGAVNLTPYFPITGVAPFVVYIDLEQMLVTFVDPSTGILYVSAADRGYNGTTQAAHSIGAYIVTTADVTIAGIVQNRLPGVPMSITPSSYLLAPAAFNMGDDPTALIASSALAASYECFFDQAGVFIAEPIADPASIAPTASYSEGPSCTFTELQRTLSNKGVPNHIIVISQGSNIPTPLRGDWYDVNPASPSYIFGPYPTTVVVVQTSLATTQPQVDAMAQALGTAALGTFDGMQITYLGDPAMDAGCVVTVTRGPSKVAAAPYIIQKGTLDLGVSTLSTLEAFRVVS
jgi:hypothetical protein